MMGYDMKAERRWTVAVAVVVALIAALAGAVGFQIGNAPGQLIVVRFEQPIPVKLQ